jgi:hypothetical protein
MKEVQNAPVTDEEIAIFMRVTRRLAARKAAAARRGWLRDIERTYGERVDYYRGLRGAASS